MLSKVFNTTNSLSSEKSSSPRGHWKDKGTVSATDLTDIFKWQEVNKSQLKVQITGKITEFIVLHDQPFFVEEDKGSVS